MYQALVGYVSNNQCDEIVNYYRCLEVLTSHIVGPTIFVMIEHTREISIYVLIEYKPSQHSRLPPAAQHSDTSTATRLTTMRIPASSRLLHDPDVNTIFFTATSWHTLFSRQSLLQISPHSFEPRIRILIFTTDFLPRHPVPASHHVKPSHPPPGLPFPPLHPPFLHPRFCTSSTPRTHPDSY